MYLQRASEKSWREKGPAEYFTKNNSGKGNNKMEKQKVNGKLKFNLKIENLYVKNKRIKDIFKSFLKYANY